MACDGKITVKFFVDKEKSRVVFAETDNDFVDILFSFLTLPMGTIIRLLNKKSQVGCMDNLYGSIENLDVEHFQTEACKTMLLRPLSAAAVRCEDLKVNIDDTKPNPRQVYVCPKPDCCAKEICLASSVLNARCPHCGECMDEVRTWAKENEDADKLFVKRGVNFVISDDLRVLPISAVHILSLFSSMGIQDAKALEERSVDLHREEILSLLSRSLVSDMPLTDLCFCNFGEIINDAPGNIIMKCVRVKREVSAEDSKHLMLKLHVNKTNNKLSFVESEEEFVNLLFSFLTFPLGSVIKLLHKNSAIRCVENLYRSIESLSSDCFKSEECKSMLLSPKLAPFFGSTGSIQVVDETIPCDGSSRGCYTCNWKNKKKGCEQVDCIHGVKNATLKELDPKSPGGTTTAAGYAKASGKFLVTDDLHVYPLSASSTIQIISKQEFLFSDIVAKDDSMEGQALDLLRAALISKDPLADVLSLSL